MSQANPTMADHPVVLVEPSPFAIPSKKLAMWLFIMADEMTFAACMAAYAFTRNATPDWPRPFHGIASVAAMTLILLTSCLTLLVGLHAAQLGDRERAFTWTMLTVLGGLIFTLLHIREWAAMIHQGVSVFHNPWGTAAFGASYYMLTGFSLLHISVGTVALAIVGLRYRGGRYQPNDLEVMNLYWQFVNLVWLFIVPGVYLINLAP